MTVRVLTQLITPDRVATPKKALTELSKYNANLSFGNSRDLRKVLTSRTYPLFFSNQD